MDLLRLPLGDQRPSAAFREMKSLSMLLQPDGSKKTLDLVRVLWLLRLPQDIRAKITKFASMSEDDLVEQADSLLGASTMAATSSTAAVTIPEHEGEDPYTLVAQQRRPRRHLQRPPAEGARRAICYFHKRFGKYAKNCRYPCSFSKNM